MAQDWSELLPELLISIGSLISVYEDLLSFSGVCSSWQSAAAAIKVDFTAPSQFPSLMLADTDGNSGTGGGFRELFLLSNDPKTNTNAIRTVNLPEASGKRCLSSKGWLFTMDSDDCYPNLLHPYTREQIRLPKLDTFPNFYKNQNENCHFIKNVILSSSQPPSDPNFLVMVIWGGKGRLGFCKLGDVSWTAINYPEEKCKQGSIRDFTYHHKKIYAVDYGRRMLVCDPHGTNPTKLKKISRCPSELLDLEYFEWLYVMTSGLNDDVLWIVSRHFEELKDMSPYAYYRTNYFQVLSFSLNKKGCKWADVEDIRERALFVGNNASFSMKTERGGCVKPNRIYFTDDVYEHYLDYPEGGGRDMGIYHYDKGTIEPFFKDRESRSLISPPLWVFDESNC